jgi:pimeloyl-ACP methyl ester carboxylesterase
MPKIRAGNIQMNYDQQGKGEPLILIPYLAADHACYAFQVAELAKHYDCISVDLRGTGESDKPGGVQSTQMYADDVASLMQELGIARAHVFGVSLGGATGMWLAATHPERVKSLSLHSAWPKSDAYLKVVVQSWQTMAKALNSVPDMVIQGILPYCLTPELYASKPEYIQSLADFVRSRPRQLVEAFLQQSEAVLAHDAQSQLGRIRAPTQITFGRHDSVTSTRFLEPLQLGIKDAESHVFENCAHAAIYEDVAGFNAKSLEFLRRHSG